MNACDHCRESLLDLLYEDPAPDIQRDARQHLAACPECAREFQELQKTIAAVRSIADPEPPAYLNTRIKAMIAEAGARPRSFWSWMTRPRLAMAALVVLAVSVTVVMHNRIPGKRDFAPLAETGPAAGTRDKDIALLTPPAPAEAEAPKGMSKAAPDSYFETGAGEHGGDDFSALKDDAPADAAAPPPPVGRGADQKETLVLKMAEEGLEPDASGTKVEEPTRDEEIEPPASELVAKTDVPSGREALGREREMAKDKEKAEKPETKLETLPSTTAPEPTAAPPTTPAIAPEPAPAPEKKPAVAKSAPEPETGSEPKKQADPGKNERGRAEERGALPQPPAAPEKAVSETRESDEDLAALGYVSDSAPGAAADGLTGPAGDKTGKEEGGHSNLAQAQALEADGKYRKALALYEQALAQMGYQLGAAERGKRDERKSGAAPEKQPPASSAAGGETGAETGGPAVSCTPDLKAAADGAIRCYRKLLMLGKAKDLEEWRRQTCPD